MTDSIRHLLLSLVLMLLLIHQAEAKTITLAWDKNPEPSVVGYKVYYKAESSAAPLDGWGAIEGDSPIVVGNLTTAKISGLMDSQTYYFAVSAYDAAGVESPLSQIVASAAVPVLTSPAQGAAAVTRPVTFRWDYAPFASGMSYTLLVGTDPKLPLTASQLAALPAETDVRTTLAGLFGLGLLGGGLALRRSRLLALLLWAGASFSLAACGGGGGGSDGTATGVAITSPVDGQVGSPGATTPGTTTPGTTTPGTTTPGTTTPGTTTPGTTTPGTTTPGTTTPGTTTPGTTTPGTTTQVLSGLTTPFATVTDLQPGTTYYWQVYAVDAQGYRYESLIHAFKTAAQ